jgi:hypothetical protein
MGVGGTVLGSLAVCLIIAFNHRTQGATFKLIWVIS